MTSSAIDEKLKSQTTSLLDSLRTQKDEETFDDAVPWIPEEEGDGIEGTVIGIGDYHDDGYGNDKVYRTWIVEDDKQNQWLIIPFHRQLRSNMAKHRAEVGDQVAILYLGEMPSATDPEKSIKRYRVARLAASRIKRVK
jgi:hypothetical protein